MRKNEEHLFNVPYPQQEANADFDRFFADTVGLQLPEMHLLSDALLADLNENAPFGIRWWAGHTSIGDKQRILIGDALCQALLSVPDNLIEAKLHLFESLDWLDRERKHMRDAVSFAANGAPRVRSPSVAKHGLDQRMIHMHATGFLRAINSTFDCLGAVVIGIIALPTPILTADLGRARRAMREVKASGSPGEVAQLEFSREFDSLIERVGPAGWLQWASDFRNMLTHRGRRMQFGQLHIEPSQVTDSRGRSRPLARVVRSMPTEPGWCEVDASLQPRALMLEEASRDTMEGLLQSSIDLVEGSSRLLSRFWSERRNNPALLAQPAAQWPKPGPPRSAGFDGYSGRLGEMGDSIVMNPTDIRRFAAAALTNDNRELWASFT